MLQEDEFLLISDKRFNQCVQFVGQGFFGIRLETTSNAYRDDAHQLTAAQIAGLVDLGLQLPSRIPEESDPLSDPDGSPNIFREFASPVDFDALAAVAVNVLNIIAVPHAGYLEYDAFSNVDGNSLSFPALGLRREIHSEDSDTNPKLPQLLLDTISELTGVDTWVFGDDGEVGGIHFCSVTAYVKILSDTPHIRIYAPLNENVEESPALLSRINELNAEYGFMHLFHQGGTIFALSDILASPFNVSIVAHWLGNFFQIADELNGVLQAEFGDAASTGEVQPTSVTH